MDLPKSVASDPPWLWGLGIGAGIGRLREMGWP